MLRLFTFANRNLPWNQLFDGYACAPHLWAMIDGWRITSCFVVVVAVVAVDVIVLNMKISHCQIVITCSRMWLEEEDIFINVVVNKPQNNMRQLHIFHQHHHYAICRRFFVQIRHTKCASNVLQFAHEILRWDDDVWWWASLTFSHVLCGIRAQDLTSEIHFISSSNDMCWMDISMKFCYRQIIMMECVTVLISIGLCMHRNTVRGVIKHWNVQIRIMMAATLDSICSAHKNKKK